MPTQKQVLANQANAKKSSGPRSATGKSASARNALTHGLGANHETLFAHAPGLQADFEAFAARLAKDFPPAYETEELAFRRYAFAAFQSERARLYETRAESDMLAAPGDHELERRYLRFANLRVKLSRETDSALKAYRKIRDERVKAGRAIGSARFAADSSDAFDSQYLEDRIPVDDFEYGEHLRNGGNPAQPRRYFVPPSWKDQRAGQETALGANA